MARLSLDELKTALHPGSLGGAASSAAGSPTRETEPCELPRLLRRMSSYEVGSSLDEQGVGTCLANPDDIHQPDV